MNMQQQGPPTGPPPGWYWNGKKWCPPAPQFSGWQVAKQLPGALLGLVLLSCLLAILLAVLWGLIAH